MTKIFTQDDIVSYAYKACTDVERHEIEQAMALDADLLNFYHDVLWIKAQMDKSMMDPPKKVIDTVLKYSKAIDLHSVEK